MKRLLELSYLSLLVLIASCSTFASKDIPLLPFEKRIYVTCPESWIDPPYGHLCYSQCIKKHTFSDKCKVWYVDKLDLNDPEVYEKFSEFEFKRI